MIIKPMKAIPSTERSIHEMLEQVMCQVEYHCFADLRYKRTDPLYGELCLIIAEVLVLRQDYAIKINGLDLSVSMVQEIYSRLTNDHVRFVFNNFRNVTNRVYNKKAYLRTALYNSVFEIEASSVNEQYCC